MKRILSIWMAAAALGFAATAADAALLDQVKQKGFVQCGVTQGLPGFSSPDDKGTWTGLDVDFCRAMAAAIFDDPTKVRYTPLTAKDRFTALQSGEIPPIRNLDDPDDEADVDAVRTVVRRHAHDVALSTSFGFGGHDVSLVLTR